MKQSGTIALLVAIAGAICATLILFGARLGLWEPITGYGFFRTYFNPLGAIILGAGLLALIIHLRRKEERGIIAGVITALVGVAVLSPLISSTLNPKPRAAPINDISTDTVNPPMFEFLDDTREGARTSLVYGGAKIAEVQAKAYPDIAPLETNLSADAAYQRALTVAQNLGWEVVASDEERRRFEATTRTPVFYLADDYVVVVTPQGEGARIDMRGVSRVGRSDQGANARRIREFQEQFQN